MSGTDAAESPQSRQQLLALPIEQTDLPNRPKKWLRRAGIRTVGELVQRSEQDLLTIRNFAETSLGHVRRYLARHGLELAPPRSRLCDAEMLRRVLRSGRLEISTRERAILRMRYGLDEERPLTLHEVGRTFNLSRERVRQIQQRAEDKVTAHALFHLPDGTN